jgi:hypothetical protein
MSVTKKNQDLILIKWSSNSFHICELSAVPHIRGVTRNKCQYVGSIVMHLSLTVKIYWSMSSHSEIRKQDSAAMNIDLIICDPCTGKSVFSPNH